MWTTTWPICFTVTPCAGEKVSSWATYPSACAYMHQTCQYPAKRWPTYADAVLCIVYARCGHRRVVAAQLGQQHLWVSATSLVPDLLNEHFGGSRVIPELS